MIERVEKIPSKLSGRQKSWTLNTPAHTNARTHQSEWNMKLTVAMNRIELHFSRFKFDIGILFCYPEKVDTWQFQNVKFSHFNTLTCFQAHQERKTVSHFISLFSLRPNLAMLQKTMIDPSENRCWATFVVRRWICCIPPIIIKVNKTDIHFWKLKKIPNWMWTDVQCDSLFFSSCSKCSFCIQMSVRIIGEGERKRRMPKTLPQHVRIYVAAFPSRCQKIATPFSYILRIHNKHLMKNVQ